MSEPRERFRTRESELLLRLGTGHDVAGWNRRRMPVAQASKDERREFGEPRGPGEASFWIAEPHAERG